MTTVPTLETKLHALRERFLAQLPVRIEELSQLLQDAKLHDLRRRFHNLAGTAGTYGLAHVGMLAAEGENVCANAARWDNETRAHLLSLVDSIRRAAGVLSDSSQRILCVEDDRDQAEFTETVLRDAGYQVQSVAEAGHFHNTLAAFKPDLILMDAVLPDGSGVTLARAVRDNPAYATVPIIFLTGDRRTSMHIEAIEAGIDDYVTKPVPPELLLSIVGARLKRSRSVQALIDYDTLTGALTRGCFFRRAETAVAAASRRHEPVALAMLDLDHFKSINDRYGHVVGDRVLIALITYLKLNLRPGDEVGRYGGEEFLLLLRDISPRDAQELVTHLIDRFARIPHTALDGTIFHVTFSAGVATCEPGSNAQSWCQRADEALYSAKHHGRARAEAA